MDSRGGLPGWLEILRAPSSPRDALGCGVRRNSSWCGGSSGACPRGRRRSLRPIRQRARDPGQRARGARSGQGALPYAQNYPPGGTQFTCHGAVAPRILCEFRCPKSHIRFGNPSMTRTSMPKAAVNKNRDLFRAEDEIRLAWQKCSTPPAMDMVFAHQRDKAEFRGTVPTGANAGHSLGALVGSERIRHNHYFGGNFMKCSAMSARISASVFLPGVFPFEVAHPLPACSVSHGERLFARVSALSPCFPNP